jgi:hypothetical protein
MPKPSIIMPVLPHTTAGAGITLDPLLGLASDTGRQRLVEVVWGPGAEHRGIGEPTLSLSGFCGAFSTDQGGALGLRNYAVLDR